MIQPLRSIAAVGALVIAVVAVSELPWIAAVVVCGALLGYVVFRLLSHH